MPFLLQKEVLVEPGELQALPLRGGEKNHPRAQALQKGQRRTWRALPGARVFYSCAALLLCSTGFRFLGIAFSLVWHNRTGWLPADQGQRSGGFLWDKLSTLKHIFFVILCCLLWPECEDLEVHINRVDSAVLFYEEGSSFIHSFIYSFIEPLQSRTGPETDMTRPTL